MRTMLGALLLFLVIFGAAVSAAAQQGSSVIGYGTAPCSAYVEAHDERGDEYFVFGAWIGGFITATGFRAAEFRSSLLNIQMPDAQAWIANYCRKKPRAFVVEAVEQYTFYLYKKYN